MGEPEKDIKIETTADTASETAEKSAASDDRFVMTREKYKFYLLRASVVMIAAAVIILLYFFFDRFDTVRRGVETIFMVLSPILVGFLIAFLLNPIMKFFERKMRPFFLSRMKDPKKAKGFVRGLSALISYVIVIVVILIFLLLIVPQISQSIISLANYDYEKTIDGVFNWLEGIAPNAKAQLEKFEIEVLNALGNLWVTIISYFNISAEPVDILKTISGLGISIGSFLLNAILSIIISIYVLLEKDRIKAHTKKIVYGLFKVRLANNIVRIGRHTKEIFYGFFVGRMIEAILVGFLCYILMSIFQFPCALICSVIIGITNIIPVLGPYIGAIPSAILIFLYDPGMVIYFIILVIVLTQIDGNVIGPAILGNSTGLSPFWVLAAIIIGGGLFGIPGMLLGIPVTAVLYDLAGDFTAWLSKKRGVAANTSPYTDLKYIDEMTGQLVQKTQDEIDGAGPSSKSIFRRWGRKIKNGFAKLRGKPVDTEDAGSGYDEDTDD